MTYTGGMRNFDVIANTVGFDAEWYAAAYPDSVAMGMSPQDHYRRLGYRMGRGVSAAIPRLRDAPDLLRALSRRPRISYCSPFMNRPDDVRATLAYNLDENRPLADDLEFVLVFMDDDRDTHDWIRSEFAQDLCSGYLRMIVEPPLDGWHFGRAKNRHRAYATGDIYSNLDGDNFVTLDETRQLLDVAAAQDDWFLFHHFTGKWGDGSSGRVSMSMKVYRDIGYDERLMPRQFDEMDLLLTAMSTWPDLPLIRLKADNHGFSAQRSQEFLTEAGITNPVTDLDPPTRHNPINPKGADYVQSDAVMEAMTAFNQGLSFVRNAPTDTLREKYRKLATKGRHMVIDALPRDRVLGTLFSIGDYPAPQDVTLGRDDVCVFACMKNDDNFLQPFYDHYKALGVARFFIIDDGSDTPIRQSLPQADVHVFHPKVGSFVDSKGMWIDGLMKAYLEPGQWALTLDADEFLDLPVQFETLSDVVRELAARDQDLLPALLIDMVPGPAVSADRLTKAETDFLSLFDHYVFVQDPLSQDYAASREVEWGFGPFKSLSWHLDTRFHGFGTFDALRKIPLIRMRPGRHVNQGFHTLHYTDDTPEPRHEIWDTDLILPIRHFKLMKLFSTAARDRMAAHAAISEDSPYHARTTANIARIFGAGGDRVEQVLALPSRPYSDRFLLSLDGRAFLGVAWPPGG